MILLRTKIMFLGRKRKAELVIESFPGTFLLGSLDSIGLMMPGVEWMFGLGLMDFRCRMVAETSGSSGPGLREN